jgi:nitrogen-specific signal transduction histidine kinase
MKQRMPPSDLTPQPTAPEPAPDSAALAALLECEADLDGLERALLAAALHPAAGAAESAWLARWDERRGVLEEWRASAAADPDGPLAGAIARARRAPPSAAEREGRVPTWRSTVQALQGACEVAWRTGEPALGTGAETPQAPWARHARIGVVPLRRGARFHGLLVLALAERPPRAPELAWLSLAAQAALAAQARAADARRRARHAAALAEFAHITVGAANVAEATHALVRLAAQSLQIRHAAYYRWRDDGALALELTHGPQQTRETQARALQLAAAEIARAPRALSGAGAAELPGPATEGTRELSVWAFQPVQAYGRLLGVLAVWDGAERPVSSPDWERGDLELAATLADHAALVFEHARRLDELGTAERRHQDLAARLREQDRVAAVGELAARVADDARAPLATMAAFTARALRELAEDDPRREYLEAVKREAERLQTLLEEQSAYARLEPPRLKMQVLNDVAQEALRAANEALSRRRVRLVKKLAPDLPTLLLDAARIRRVLENIVACALESVPIGGRMRVETRRAGAFVVLDVLHDRARSDGDVLEQLFAPFGAGRASGAALGLGVAQQIVREHGGEIRVRTEDEWSNVFSVTLPVLANQERRRLADRRGARPERRRRGPEA